VVRAERSRRGGFTLIELLTAVLIAAGIAAAAMVAVSQALRARDLAESRGGALSRAGAAADMIALDLLNLVRAGDLYDARFLLADGGGAGEAQRDELLIFAHSARQARAVSEQNEGGAYEVQYRLRAAPEGEAWAGVEPGLVLWRRIDPVPDRNPAGGGVASPVVTGVLSLSIEAFDGAAWHAEWDSDRDGYPHAARVTVSAGQRSSRGGVVRADARRTVAFDRTPAP
jgi:type II secretion system protein J